MRKMMTLKFILSFVLLLILTGMFLSQSSSVESLALYTTVSFILILIQVNISRTVYLKSFKELEEAKNQLNHILDSIPGFVSWINKDLVYEGVNHRMAQFFQLQPYDFVNKKLGEVTIGEHSDLIDHAKALFLSNVELIQFETSFFYENKTYWSLLTMQKFNNGEHALLVSIDITDLKTAQEKLKIEEATAIQAGRLASVGEMMATITHEINNPLGTLTTANTFMKRQLEKDEIDKDRFRQIIEMNTTALTTIDKIIKSVKNLVRDGGHDRFETIKLNQIVDDVLIFIAKKCQDQHIKLEVPDDLEKYKIHCIPVQITQVLLILFNNAIDAIYNQKEKWIKITIQSNEQELVISVIDSGLGIKPEIAKKIFDNFYTTKKRGKGTGIGLGLAKKVAKSHKGDLILNNEAKNTQFDLIIPYIK